MATVSAAKTDPKEEAKESREGWRLSGLSIEVADNGFILREDLRKDMKRGEKGEPMGIGNSYKEDRKVFPDAASLCAYLESELTAHAKVKK